MNDSTNVLREKLCKRRLRWYKKVMYMDWLTIARGCVRRKSRKTKWLKVSHKMLSLMERMTKGWVDWWYLVPEKTHFCYNIYSHYFCITSYHSWYPELFSIDISPSSTQCLPRACHCSSLYLPLTTFTPIAVSFILPSASIAVFAHLPLFLCSSYSHIILLLITAPPPSYHLSFWFYPFHSMKIILDVIHNSNNTCNYSSHHTWPHWHFT